MFALSFKAFYIFLVQELLSCIQRFLEVVGKMIAEVQKGPMCVLVCLSCYNKIP